MLRKPMIKSINAKIWISTILFIILVIIIAWTYRWWIYDPVPYEGEKLAERKAEHGDYFLNWAIKETILYDYEECKNINRSKPIKRLLKPDYMLPMCSPSKFMLYDESQKIVFIFNEDSSEPGTVGIISTSYFTNNSLN